jgi:hypothetical protein
MQMPALAAKNALCDVRLMPSPCARQRLKEFRVIPTVHPPLPNQISSCCHIAIQNDSSHRNETELENS